MAIDATATDHRELSGPDDTLNDVSRPGNGRAYRRETERAQENVPCPGAPEGNDQEVSEAPPLEKPVGMVDTVGTSRHGATSSLPMGCPSNTGRWAPGHEEDPEVGEPETVTVDRRLCFGSYLTLTRFGSPGLYYHGVRQPRGEGEPEAFDLWLSSPLECVAMTRDERDDNHGLLLRFLSSSGKWRTWAMPLELLKGSGEEMRGALLNMGVRIHPDGHRHLTRYLMEQHPDDRVVAATRVGWHLMDETRVFVMPRTTIGRGAQRVTFQSEYASNDDFAARGRLEDWQERIGRLCRGNPWLVLAVSTALAGPLLDLAHRRAVGIHLYGDSSGGKTTALEVAASVWGGPDFKRTWNGTGNGQEAIATALSDTLIALDEISEADSRSIGNTVYMLGNGVGKARAARTGTARQPQRWRIAILSSGERSLAAHMREGGLKPRAGQIVRLLDIPARRHHGVFDVLHHFEDGRALADHLKSEVTHCHGTLGPAFIERLVKDGPDIPAELDRFAQLPGFTTAHPLQGRAAKALALIGLAGELATEYGLTGWAPQQAMEAALLAFTAWKAEQGGIPSEHEQILASVQTFIERHGDARFSDIQGDAVHAATVRDRAGYWRDDAGGRLYLFNGEGLKEALGGFDLNRGLDALDTAGWIAEREGRARSIKIQRRGQRGRFYAIRPTEDIGVTP